MPERLNSRFTVYQFLVRLCGFRPTIWRRLRVADCTLAELHQTIQVAFGFDTRSAYRFAHCGSRAAGAEAADLEPGEWLSEILPLHAGDFCLRYESGPAGEPWRCRVWFEGWMISSFNALYPLCVEGERAGVPKPMTPTAYAALLHASERTQTRDADGLKRSDVFDPETIDVETINACLLRSCWRPPRDDQLEPLIRMTLEPDEWVPFWDWACVDEDERERFMCAASQNAVWLYLPEALNCATNLTFAAIRAESNASRALFDRLVGRLHRHVVLHRLEQSRCRAVNQVPQAPTGPLINHRN